jgi:hypothetical protein
MSLFRAECVSSMADQRCALADSKREIRYGSREMLVAPMRSPAPGGWPVPAANLPIARPKLRIHAE